MQQCTGRNDKIGISEAGIMTFMQVRMLVVEVLVVVIRFCFRLRPRCFLMAYAFMNLSCFTLPGAQHAGISLNLRIYWCLWSTKA